ncbi:metallophosphoesterase [Cohnella sp. CIP 111063]|uniref:metallophosphoesterase family protein n=1 Tax=unclassified Cohnella TaxID=2636738 RepID=UPI000B8BD32A|nr:MULTISPECIES: metallophosphoesterase family protein [unclassified Cohnella]OXS61239.1 metallophosphoesterase [Cohnella sp. CIP 111063]PRX73810.1 calcineurin-like phosphoesterase family protein [Cohnella sp. SGD-V74]
MSRTMKFRADGTFVIVQFSDVEFIADGDYDPDTPDINAETRKTMETVIAAERPDLIVFAGDVTASARGQDPLASFRQAVAPAEERDIPWAAVFGNHDSEGAISRRRMHEEQLAHRHCVASEDPPHLSGAGNYSITLADSGGSPAAALIFLDSGDYSAVPSVGGYDWVRRDQIEWYAAESGRRTAANGGVPLPSLAFFHIPLPEYREVWETRTCEGHCFEGISSPRVNSGLFAAMLEMGDVMGAFVGHDHANDYSGELHGIRLCYGRSTRYVSYIDGARRDRFKTGARVIRLKAGERSFDTWIRQNDGSLAELPVHLPKGGA